MTTPAPPRPPARTWDLFCRVIDNHGDAGVCWRLAADLGARGESVRLWIDDPRPLHWMAPRGAPGVELRAWREPFAADDVGTVGEVVVEAFGCALPQCWLQRMAARPVAPVWINLEYLSAEPYVERSHGLASPQFAGAGAGLKKWFFYPGFSPRTGGLLREPDLLAQRSRFDGPAWLRSQGWAAKPGERVVSLFCYAQPALDAWLDALAGQPTLLLAAHGAAAAQVAAALGPGLRRGRLHAVLLPALAQTAYDRLLWSCALNFVRGEDSFVRAQWAGQPFVWQIYPQHDGADGPKLEAFLDRHLARADAALAAPLRALWRAWNQCAMPTAWPAASAWQRQAQDWRDELAVQPDLVTGLLRFVAEKSGETG